MNPAEKLIAVAGQSAEMEAWISRQLKAGQKPSQILAELNQAQPLFDRVCNALASGSVRVAAGMSLTFAMTVVALAVGVH